MVELATAEIKDTECSSSPFDYITILNVLKETVEPLAETRLGLISNVSSDDFITSKRDLNVFLR